MTCQTLLGLEDASKSKPHLVSPMFKGMEGQSMHVIGIIKNGYNHQECHRNHQKYPKLKQPFGMGRVSLEILQLI